MLTQRQRLFILSRRATRPVRRVWYRARHQAARDYRFILLWLALLLFAVAVQPLLGYFEPGCRAASSLVPDF